MAKETKADLLERIARLERENEALRDRVKKLEIIPGEFTIDRFSSARYVARPMPEDYETRKWIEDGAHNLVPSGDFNSSGDEVTEVFESRWEEDLPPGVDAVICKYSYSDSDGIIMAQVWPAVRTN